MVYHIISVALTPVLDYALPHAVRRRFTLPRTLPRVRPPSQERHVPWVPAGSHRSIAAVKDSDAVCWEAVLEEFMGRHCAVIGL